MLKKNKLSICCGVVLFLFTSCLIAEESESAVSSSINCSSTAGVQKHCSTDTSAGVILQKSTGSADCLLGKTWGYDDTSIWVKDGCSGKFMVKQTRASTDAPAGKPDAAAKQSRQYEEWGELSPGHGFLLHRSDKGEARLSGYGLVRYMNQMPAEQTYTDHNGDTHTTKGRQDIYGHRVMAFLYGWIADPKLIYAITWWSVPPTDQTAFFINIGYQFDKKFNLYVGVNGNPGTRSLFGSHPYWLGNDRVMADEFFRPYFTQGIWANGEILPGLWYSMMVGNSSSILGVTANDLDRNFTTGGSLWWMPTTHEFGPRGGYGDWEYHDSLATRFGFSTVYSPEQRYQPIGTDSKNTTLKLADGLNVFNVNALAPGVTITNVDYRVLSLDAGFKYKGFFFQTEFYRRWLNGFEADGALPMDEIVDDGFYIQTAFFPVKKKIELYLATSQIYGDESAGFSDSSEYLVGMNWYPYNSRDYRLNLQVIDVNHSPVGSTFGYYTTGQDGTTASLAFMVFF